jgi:hypothetical protein
MKCLVGDYLMPHGLARMFVEDSARVSHHFTLLDNSGSMSCPDGSSIMNGKITSGVSRMQEAKESAIEMAKLN